MKIMMKHFIRNAEEIVSGVFLSITICTVIINVFLRYIFNLGLFWSEEVATACFVWSVFIGASACYKRKMHIGIDFLVKMTSKNSQTAIKFIVEIILIIINAYIVYLAAIFIRVSYVKPTAVLGISSAFVSTSLLVGFGLITMHAISFFINDVRLIFNGMKKI